MKRHVQWNPAWTRDGLTLARVFTTLHPGDVLVLPADGGPYLFTTERRTP